MTGWGATGGGYKVPSRPVGGHGEIALKRSWKTLVMDGFGIPGLQTGQRLCQSRFVLKSELFDNPEGSSYWLAQDRDEEEEVLIYFPPETIASEPDLVASFFEKVTAWGDQSGSDWHSVVYADAEAKPLPVIALRSRPGVGLDKRLLQGGKNTVWEDIEPLIEKVAQHCIAHHRQKHIHGKLSADHIRFLPNDDVFFVGPQLDRLAIQTIMEATGKPVSESWDPNASPECLASGECRALDEVYALASVLLESIRQLGIHVHLPRNVHLEGNIRFGNLVVPKNVKQALMDAMDEHPKNRPQSVARLAALMGFEMDAAEAQDHTWKSNVLSPDASERRRIFIRSLFRPKVIGTVVAFVALGLVGWGIVNWREQQQNQETQAEQSALLKPLELEIREERPEDLLAVKQRGTSTLKVTTIPQEALVTLSRPGQAEVMEELAPVEWNHLQEGAYRVSVLAVGYAPTNVFPFLKSGKTNVLRIQLQESFTQVSLSTEPSGGQYRFQDNQGKWVTGGTPDTIEIPKGNYMIHFSLNGETRSEALEVKSYVGKGMEVVATFGGCLLKVWTYPEEVEVWEDGEMIGVTPLDLSNVSKGVHELSLRKEGFETVVETVLLTPDDPYIVRVKMEPNE